MSPAACASFRCVPFDVPRSRRPLVAGVAAAVVALLPACAGPANSAHTAGPADEFDALAAPDDGAAAHDQVAPATFATIPRDQSPTPAVEPCSGDLRLDPLRVPEHGYALLTRESSQGRFPSGLAVVRLAFHADGDTAGARRVAIDPLRDNEAAYWTHLFDDVPAIREVVLLGTHTVSPVEPRIEQFIRAAADFNCSLCLTYSACGDGIEDAWQIGALWDTAGVAPLAAFRAAAVVERTDYEQCLLRKPQDERICRADFLAARAFERFVQAAVLELIGRDAPAVSTQPSPWKNRPFLPANLYLPFGWPWWQ